MAAYPKKRFHLGASVRPLFVIAVLVYLVFHALNGNHGLYAYLKENARLESQQAELAELRNQRARLETQVAHLGNRSLDLDLLEERVRQVLGYADESELIYVLPEDELR